MKLLPLLCALLFIPTCIQGKKVQVDIYMESKCPDTIRFIKESLPTTYNYVKNITQFNFIPYGNAKEDRNQTCGWNFECQHGVKECHGNFMEVCTLFYLKDKDLQVKFIHCVENDEVPEEAGHRCLVEVGKDKLWKKVNKCIGSSLSGDLHHLMAVKTNNLSPKHTFIPWIVIDDTPLEYNKALNPQDFTKAIKNAYKTM